jgi:hypothetical protein
MNCPAAEKPNLFEIQNRAWTERKPEKYVSPFTVELPTMQLDTQIGTCERCEA